ncbi:M20/M25/M40 family metallo-hydrolase [Luteitalea sp.]|uniref:M20/M25/M40 family metallo-hydrolase n=1 Tax=Luteitalea sp. TaxID=2004800 RepID=UPI0025C516B0|nr:M20/M25/M40 family metallo-hydrolase [Luteitalea sp.]
MARAAGAVALLILLPDAVNSAEWRGRRTWCNQGELRPSSVGAALPVIFLSQEASAVVRSASTSDGETAEVQLTRSSRPHRGINVVGRFGPVSSEAIVVTAHLDHIGVVADETGRRRIAPGAVDNASGVAALLELGQRLGAVTSPSRTVILAATDAEEAGLVGSMVLVDQLARVGLKVVANVNIDGATLMQHRLFNLVALGGKDSQLGELAVDAGRDVGVEMALEHTPIAGSDHFPFAMAGIPAVWLVAGTKANVDGMDGYALQDRWMREVYHSPKDSMAQRLDFTAAARLLDVVEALVRRLAGAGQPAPEWHAGAVWSTEKR